MGDTVTTMRFYEQIKREKRAKEKWNQKYLTAEQLERVAPALARPRFYQRLYDADLAESAGPSD